MDSLQRNQRVIDLLNYVPEQEPPLNLHIENLVQSPSDTIKYYNDKYSNAPTKNVKNFSKLTQNSSNLLGDLAAGNRTNTYLYKGEIEEPRTYRSDMACTKNQQITNFSELKPWDYNKTDEGDQLADDHSLSEQ